MGCTKEEQEFWRQHVKRLRESGRTRARYCRENGLSCAKMRYWERRFPDPKASPLLVEVPFTAWCGNGVGAVRGSAIRIHAVPGGGFFIEVDPDFDALTLERVLRVVAGL